MTQQIRSTTLDNGLRVVLEPMPWLPSLSFSFLLPFGVTTDPEHLQGSSVVLSDWMLRGAAGKDARAWSDALDNLGVRRGHNTTREFTTFSGSLLSDALPETLALYADMLQAPELTENEFSSARALALEDLASIADNPTQLMFRGLLKEFFASEHGRSGYGSQEGLEALTADTLRTDYQQRVGPQGAILSVAGGISWDDLLPLVEKTLGAWQGGSAPSYPAVQLSHQEPTVKTHLMDANTSQVHIGLAFDGPNPGDDTWYPHAVAGSVLSGGMGTRLFTEVREKRGLVYSVYAAMRSLRSFGYGVAYAGTTPERADTTLEVLLAELDRMREGVRADELDRARIGILSSLVMQGEASGSRASALVRDCFTFGEPRSLDSIKQAINACSLDDVNTYLATRPQVGYTVARYGPTMEVAEAS
ncbi:MAG: pitrilysin family protein [Deinococcota bacterium]